MMRKSSRCARAFMLASLAGLAPGCGDGAQAPEGRAPSSAPDNDTLLFDVYAAEDGGVAGENGNSTQDAGAQWSDGQLVGILAVLTDQQILLGLAGQWGGTDPRVQSLGAELASAHRDARARQLALGILPEPSERASQYAQSGATVVQRLQSMPAGAAYDYAYLELQIMFDAIVINEIDKQWLPSAQGLALRAELATTRDEIKNYLDREVALRNELRLTRADAGSGEQAVSDAGQGASTTHEDPAAL